MKQRVMIAMAIACKPKLLIADEPTTSLDVTIQKQVLDLLVELREKLNMAILFITHDLAVASQVSDKIIVLKDGKIIEENNAKEFFKLPKNSYSKSLLESSVYNRQFFNNQFNSENDILSVQNLKVFYQEKKSFFGNNSCLLYTSDAADE